MVPRSPAGTDDASGAGRPGPPTTVVIPCFNEEGRLPVDRILAFAGSRPHIRLLFVDDGSSDGTGDVLAALVRRVPTSLGHLSLERNVGKSEAVRLGILRALEDDRVRYVGFWDADLSTPVEAIPELLAVHEAHPGLVLVMGARVKLLGRHVVRRAVRHYTGRVFATAASLTLRLPVYDTQCGAKLFRVGGLTRRIFQDPFVSRWIFDVEILARMIRYGPGDGLGDIEGLVYEYPLQEWVHVPGSRLRLRDYVRAALDLARIRRRYLRGGP